MNSDLPSTPREEWEARLTALLLDELDPAESARVQEAIARDPELARLHDQLRQTIDLVRAASAQPSEPLPGVTGLPKMSGAKRAQLLEQLRGPTAAHKAAPSATVTEASPQVIPVRFDEPSEARPSWRPSRRRLFALAAVLVALLGMAGFLTENFRRPRASSLARLEERSIQAQPERLVIMAQKARSIDSVPESQTPTGTEAVMPPQLANRYGLRPRGGPAGEAVEEAREGAMGAGGVPIQLPAGGKRPAEYYAATDGPKPVALPQQNAPETMLNTMAGPRESYTQAGPSTTTTRTRNVLEGFFGSLQDGTKPNADASTPADPATAGLASATVEVPQLVGADHGRNAAPDASRGESLNFQENRNLSAARPIGSLPVTDAPAAGVPLAANGVANFDVAASTLGRDFAPANRPSLEELPTASRPDSAKEPQVRGLAGDATKSTRDASALGIPVEATPRPAPDQVWAFRAKDGVASDEVGNETRANQKFESWSVGTLEVDAVARGFAKESQRGATPEALGAAATESKSKAEQTLGLEGQVEVGLRLADTEAVTTVDKLETAGRARGAVGLRTQAAPRSLTRAAGAAGATILEKKVAQTTETRFAGGKLLERESLNGPATPAPVPMRRGLLESVGALEDRLERAAPTPAPIPPPVPQPEVTAADNAFSTFSLNVADVSFKLAGASLERGALPEPSSIRSEEFINALRYHDPEPAPGAPFGFAWDRAQYPFAHHRDVLRLSLRTAALGREAGRPLNLVLTLDASGSMERADRVQIVREALRVLARQLRPTDRVSLVTFARTARLTVDALPGNRAAELVDRVAALTPEGGTNLEDALRIAYEAALRHYLADGVNRVILFTDGAANLGDVRPDSLQRTVESYRQRGVALDCFGIGWEGLNDDLLEVLSRHGDGRYGFLNSTDDVASGFVDQLAGALQVAAADVKVQVEFNPRRVTTWRQVGYARHQLKKEQFRDNTVDAAELGAAESGTAVYVIETNPQGDGPLGVLRTRSKDPATGAYREHEWPLPYSGPSVALEQASPALRLATTSAAFAESLAGLPFAADVTADRLLGYLQGVPAIFQPDPRPARLEWMIRQAKSIRGN